MFLPGSSFRFSVVFEHLCNRSTMITVTWTIVRQSVERHEMMDIWSNGEEEEEEVAWDADEKK